MRRTILITAWPCRPGRPRAGRLQRLRESRRRQESVARRVQDRLAFAAHHAAQRRAASAAAGRAPAAGSDAGRPGQGGAVAGAGRRVQQRNQARPAPPGAPAAPALGAALVRRRAAAASTPTSAAGSTSDTKTINDSDKTFIDSLIFWQDPPPAGVVIDPTKEQQRMRDAQAAGQPASGSHADHQAAQARPARRHLLRPAA